jgi:hypothetical protein
MNTVAERSQLRRRYMNLLVRYAFPGIWSCNMAAPRMPKRCGDRPPPPQIARPLSLHSDVTALHVARGGGEDYY